MNTTILAALRKPEGRSFYPLDISHTVSSALCTRQGDKVMLYQKVELSGQLVINGLTKGHKQPAFEILEGLEAGSELRCAMVLEGKLVLFFRRHVKGTTKGIDTREDLEIKLKTIYKGGEQ
jgi:hypothetical protein